VIPLRDANPTRRTPFVTVSLIAACFVVFAWELGLTASGGQAALDSFVTRWGVVPADARLFAEESEASLVARMAAIRTAMAEYVDPTLLVRQSLITPSCGIKFANEEEADRIQRMAAAIARAWRGAV
jgi:hypothetical protein